MRRLSVLFLLVALGCGDGGHVQQNGPPGKWRLLAQSGGVTSIDGTFLRNVNDVAAQQGFLSATGTLLGSTLLILIGAAFSNGIVNSTNQFSGSFAPMVVNFDDLVISFSATLSPDGKSLTGTFTETGRANCFIFSPSGSFVGSQL
jgi:hypothetical protein